MTRVEGPTNGMKGDNGRMLKCAQAMGGGKEKDIGRTLLLDERKTLDSNLCAECAVIVDREIKNVV